MKRPPQSQQPPRGRNFMAVAAHFRQAGPLGVKSRKARRLEEKRQAEREAEAYLTARERGEALEE